MQARGMKVKSTEPTEPSFTSFTTTLIFTVCHIFLAQPMNLPRIVQAYLIYIYVKTWVSVIQFVVCNEGLMKATIQ